MTSENRILFVDDDAALLRGLRRMLLGSDWSIECASSVDEALAILNQSSNDVVVSDIGMPGKDGFALLAAIRGDARLADVPVILLTGLDDEELKEKALGLGATDLLNKPVRRGDLVARVRNALQLRSYLTQLNDQNARLELLVEARTRELSDSRVDIIWCLARASEERDGLTGRHVVRVAANAAIIARELGLPPQLVELMTLASPLHDVGKIGIPDSILSKPGPLTAEEKAIMQRHCEIGAEILNPDSSSARLSRVWRIEKQETAEISAQGNPLLVVASTIALAHHERWGGSGYPGGVQGESIPIEARITSLADVYDALRSARPYKVPLSDARALQVIEQGVGGQFDPDVYAAFQRGLPEIRRAFENLADAEDHGAQQAA